MKVILMTKGVEDRITTPKILERCGIPYEILCHTKEDAQRLANKFGVEAAYCNPPEGPLALGHIRDFMLREMVGRGEWYVGVDDNISEVYEPPPETVAGLERVDEDPDWRSTFMTPIQDDRLSVVLRELQQKCVLIGTVYGGFGYIDNYFFRRTKWSYLSYVKAKLYVAKNDGVPWRWDERLRLMLDHAKTFDVISRYGCVVVNRWVFPEHPRFQPGGLGSLAERMPARLASCEVFREKFGGLVRIQEGESGELDNPQLRLRSLNAVRRWRQENGFWEAFL